jgi:lipopolysaccharide/colanic/teichoic acid biosynthesis glycosyltransferase
MNRPSTMKGRHPGDYLMALSYRAPKPADAATSEPMPALLFHGAARRAFDLVAAIVGLVIFSPTFLLVSMAIRIDSRAPIFRRLVRHGYDGAEVSVLTFRSNEIARDAKNSSGMTRIGCFLHGTGLDALPQLMNVLSGEMSIVGPEPLLTPPKTILADKISLLSRVHKMKPGLTGWAQVNGCRGESNTAEATQRRVEYDMYYIENRSLLLDMKIIAMTVFSEWRAVPLASDQRAGPERKLKPQSLQRGALR